MKSGMTFSPSTELAAAGCTEAISLLDEKVREQGGLDGRGRGLGCGRRQSWRIAQRGLAGVTSKQRPISLSLSDQ